MKCLLNVDSIEKNKSESQVRVHVGPRSSDAGFMDYTVYNFYTNMKEEEIRLTIQLLNLLYKDKDYLSYVFTISHIETNLELYIQSHYLLEIKE